MLDEARIAKIDAEVLRQEAAGITLNNKIAWHMVGGNYAELSQYLKAVRAQRRTGERGAVAVDRLPPLSAVEAWQEARDLLVEEQAALTQLRAHQTPGERLSRDEQLDLLSLEASVAQTMQYEESLRAPMLAEVRAGDLEDVAAALAAWVPPVEAACTQMFQGMAAAIAGFRGMLQVHQARDAALNQMTAFRNLALELPSGHEIARNMASRLPEGGGWVSVFQAALAGPLTQGHVQAAKDACTSLTPPDAKTLGLMVEQQQQRRR
jgi:hypothetical protein